jgi:hypothetical protein
MINIKYIVARRSTMIKEMGDSNPPVRERKGQTLRERAKLESLSQKGILY